MWPEGRLDRPPISVTGVTAQPNLRCLRLPGKRKHLKFGSFSQGSELTHANECFKLDGVME
jgi:hypothetical protein